MYCRVKPLMPDYFQFVKKHFRCFTTGIFSTPEVKHFGLDAQSCPTLYNPQGSSVHGIFQVTHWSGLPFPSPEIPPGLFKSLKGWWWWCHQSFVFIMSANLENSTMATELEKINPHPNSQEEFTEEWVNHWTITLISHSSKVILKILQARLQHYVNQKLPDVQAWIRQGRGTRDQIANIFWIIEKARKFQKNHLLSLFHWLH